MNLKCIKIKEYLSFEPNVMAETKYKLITVESKIVRKFISDVNNLDKNPDHLLCLRGDSKKTEEEHNDFIYKTLNRLFIIGNKANSYYQSENDDDFEYYEGKNKVDLINEIQELINTCNYEVEQKNVKNKITGNIKQNFIDSLNQKDINELEHWRLFFISFLHNNGIGKKYKRFKNYSPFISLTYGRIKKSTSIKFALKRTKHSKGLVYIVAIDLKKKDYILTRNLTKELSDFGIKWYEDTHRECMLLNGIFPHSILGIFEIENPKTITKLIINPWLYNEYKKGRNYDSENGIPVNQELFQDWIKDSMYKRFYQEYPEGDQYISELNQSNKPKKINQFN